MLPPPSPNSIEEELDFIIDLMRNSDAVRIRRQFRSYSGLAQDMQPGDLVYAAVLPPPGNSRKLQIKWSGPLVITEIVNDAMIKIKELNVNKPRVYLAHRSKIILAKKMGQKDPDPIFRLPRLPKDDMDHLAEELGEFELPGKSNQDVTDEVLPFSQENEKTQRRDDSTDDSSAKSSRFSVSSKISTGSRSSKSRSKGSRSEEEFVSFNKSPDSSRSEASDPEREFSNHFNLEDLETEELNQALQDSDTENEEPVSAAAQLIPDPEQVPEEPQPERSVRKQSINQAINNPTRRRSPEPEKEKYAAAQLILDPEQVPEEPQPERSVRNQSITQTIDESTSVQDIILSPEPEKEKFAQLRISEKGDYRTNLPPAGSETPSRRKSDRVSKPIERFDAAQFKTPSIVSKAPSSRGRAKSTLKSVLSEAWKDRPAPTIRDPRARSVSRESSTSTKTRAASLEKLRTGSIKSSKSVESRKSSSSIRYQVEPQVEDQVDQGEESGWSDTDNEKEGGGVNVILGQKLRIAKAKNSVVLQPRQGKWIPLDCNFDHRDKNEFLFPVLFNTLIERNLMASKFSPQAGASRSCAIYIINCNDIFVQVKRGESLGQIISLQMQGEQGTRRGEGRTDLEQGRKPSL